MKPILSLSIILLALSCQGQTKKQDSLRKLSASIELCPVLPGISDYLTDVHFYPEYSRLPSDSTVTRRSYDSVMKYCDTSRKHYNCPTGVELCPEYEAVNHDSAVRWSRNDNPNFWMGPQTSPGTLLDKFKIDDLRENLVDPWSTRDRADTLYSPSIFFVSNGEKDSVIHVVRGFVKRLHWIEMSDVNHSNYAVMQIKYTHCYSDLQYLDVDKHPLTLFVWQVKQL